MDGWLKSGEGNRTTQQLNRPFSGEMTCSKSPVCKAGLMFNSLSCCEASAFATSSLALFLTFFSHACSQSFYPLLVLFPVLTHLSVC